jgi:anthranilate synthase component I
MSKNLKNENNMNIHFNTNYIKTLSDTHTPVEMYLKIRDKFPHSFLLESSDYKSKENSYSYLCLQPIASFVVTKNETEITLPNERKTLKTNEISVADELYKFSQQFKADDLGFDFVSNGLFGYTSYDAIPLFEEIEFSNQDFSLPLMQYHVFKYIIVFNHFNNELYIIEHLLEGETSSLEELNDIVQRRAVHQYKFYQTDRETSNFSDELFLEKIKKGIEHCHLGDVFQVVLSRKFKTGFNGDEFNVYRALRSVNPSPYLFYFDYGDFKIFGSSPEAQLTIKHKKATINPIAGTFRRTGNLKDDEQLAIQLSNDPKENAEHIMLVDLARNDLSRNSKQVHVESYKQVEYYSHVIHLVSKVSAILDDDYNPVKILGDTYPAGTLSGAPKHRAMQIIDENEPNSRGFYGGAIGYMGFNGEFNHAIFIRSFLSFQNELHYQAGCGIVAKSNPESELQEVNNKLSALRKAVELAKTI